MKQLVYTMFITNNHASFLLWWKENSLNYQKVSKYYEHDIRKSGISLLNSFSLWKVGINNAIDEILQNSFGNIDVLLM